LRQYTLSDYFGLRLLVQDANLVAIEVEGFFSDCMRGHGFDAQSSNLGRKSLILRQERLNYWHWCVKTWVISASQ